MKNSNIKINSVYKNNGISYADIMSEILQNEVLINNILKQENINLKEIKEKRSKI